MEVKRIPAIMGWGGVGWGHHVAPPMTLAARASCRQAGSISLTYWSCQFSGKWQRTRPHTRLVDDRLLKNPPPFFSFPRSNEKHPYFSGAHIVRQAQQRFHLQPACIALQFGCVSTAALNKAKRSSGPPSSGSVMGAAGGCQTM